MPTSAGAERRLRGGGNIGGNLYDKYNTRNPLSRRLMAGFLADFDALTGPLPIRTAFEVGCGEGELTLRLLRRGVACRGCDLDAPVVAEARRRIGQAGYGAELTATSIYDLDPEASAADLVVCGTPFAQEVLSLIECLFNKGGPVGSHGIERVRFVHQSSDRNSHGVAPWYCAIQRADEVRYQ